MSTAAIHGFAVLMFLVTIGAAATFGMAVEHGSRGDGAITSRLLVTLMFAAATLFLAGAS